MKNKKKGFTLIELIVVVAVMGILAGIIFVAMGPARKKAKDSKMQNSLIQLQSVAERIYLDERNYNKVDPGQSPEILALQNDIAAQGGDLKISKSSSPASYYCAYSLIPSSPDYSFCIDSQLTFIKRTLVEVSRTCSSGRYCPTASLQCLDLDCNGQVDSDDRDTVVKWVGAFDGGGPNLNNLDYDCDSNSNGVQDGDECDARELWKAINYQDVAVFFGQMGATCSAPWCPGPNWCPQAPTGSCP
jgi:prepilin-type N-terminal cleavage/methylation domain-containing protein